MAVPPLPLFTGRSSLYAEKIHFANGLIVWRVAVLKRVAN